MCFEIGVRYRRSTFRWWPIEPAKVRFHSLMRVVVLFTVRFATGRVQYLYSFHARKTGIMVLVHIVAIQT